MYKKIPITDVFAREILDSRGNPTLEVEVLAGEKTVGRAQVPAGASKGFYEAIELRDGELRYHGLGVERAVNHVNDQIAREIIGMDVFDQCAIDHVLQKLDGTKDKSHLGANAMLGVSLASAKAAAAVLEIPLYRYIGGINAKKLPIPMMNVINGGKHASNDLDMQEFMIMPIKFSSFKENLRVCVEIYHTLQKVLEQKGYQSSVGDEGGFAPNLTDTEEVLSLLVKAIGKAGYRAGEDVAIALDVAASELYNKEFKKYVFAGEGKKSGQSVIRSSEEMIAYYQQLVHEYPIVSLEDPLDEDDWEGWKRLTECLGRRVQLVGDDLFVTNSKRLQKGIDRQIGNAILIKVNQIGTLTEAMDVIELARKSGYNIIISHRSGETEDSLIADLSIAVNAGQIKAGAPCRGERISKYNQLLRIEEQSWI